MIRNTDSLIKEFFYKTNLAEVTSDELVKLKEDHPYASVFSYLYSLKLKEQNIHQFNKEFSHTKLFFNNYKWLHFLLFGEGEIEVIKGIPRESTVKVDLSSEVLEKIETNTEIEVITPSEKELNAVESAAVVYNEETPVEMAFEPYHTVDYFASQGIKIGQIDSADKLGQKVKSFTAWLKTMKKIQGEEDKNVTVNYNLASQDLDNEQVENMVITESMAEIYQKQGLNDKAIEVYNKLSLQNPHNSHIFVDRIKALKENRP